MRRCCERDGCSFQPPVTPPASTNPSGLCSIRYSCVSNVRLALSCKCRAVECIDCHNYVLVPRLRIQLTSFSSFIFQDFLVCLDTVMHISIECIGDRKTNYVCVRVCVGAYRIANHFGRLHCGAPWWRPFRTAKERFAHFFCFLFFVVFFPRVTALAFFLT